MIIPSKRTEKIHYAIREIVEKSRQLEKKGIKVLPLNIGDPMKFDFSIPMHMQEAVKKGLADTGSYSYATGIPEALDAIKKEASRDHRCDVSTDDIAVTNGLSEGITFALGCLLNPGENILLPRPVYPMYTAAASYNDAECNFYDLDEENSWMPDVGDIRKNVNDKTQAIVVINPNNPTGGVYSKKNLKAVLDIAAENKLVVFADEIYSKMVYDDMPFYPMASLTKDAPVVAMNGLSKSYLCPGWRAGWLVFHDPQQQMQEYKNAVFRVLRARLCPVHPTQLAIKPALEGPQDHLPLVNKKLKERAQITYKMLNEIDGISCVKPKGAFYAFPKIDVPVPDREFVEGFLMDKHVMMVYGSGFGQKEGTKHFRVVFLPEPHVLEDAYNRLADYMKKIRQ